MVEVDAQIVTPVATPNIGKSSTSARLLETPTSFRYLNESPGSSRFERAIYAFDKTSQLTFNSDDRDTPDLEPSRPHIRPNVDLPNRLQLRTSIMQRFSEEENVDISSYRPLHLMVDNKGKIIEPNNEPVFTTHKKNRGGWKKSKAAKEAQKIRRLGKAVYMLRVDSFEKNEIQSGAQSCTLNDNIIVKHGTAVHIGRGYFITCAHNCKWNTDKTGVEHRPETHEYELTLVSGSGDLSRPNSQKARAFGAKIIAFPDELASKLSSKREPSLLPSNFEMDEFIDICLLKAIDQTWISRLRSKSRPVMLTAKQEHNQDTFDVMFIGINGCSDPLEIYTHSKDDSGPPINTKEEALRMAKRVLPRRISYARGNGQSWGNFQDDVQPKANGSFIKTNIGCLQGSSGSTLVREKWGRMIGWIIGGIIKGPPEHELLDESCLTIALAFEGDKMKRFVRDHIYPALTGNRRIRKHWLKLLDA